MLTIHKTMEDGKTTFALEGRLDTNTSPELNEEVEKAFPETTSLIFDFEKLTYISSAGLRVLLSAQRRMNQQGDMKVVKVGKAVMDVFEVTGFSDILTIE